MGLPSACRLPELIQKLELVGGRGTLGGIATITHYYKEIAVLFNYSSLKKHAGFAFFYF